MIRPIAQVLFLSALLFSGAARLVHEWLMHPSIDGTPARLWTVTPPFVAVLIVASGLIDLAIAWPRSRQSIWRRLNDLIQRGAAFFVGAAWLVSWQQLMPTPWTWLWPVLGGVSVTTLLDRDRSSWLATAAAALWISVAVVIGARFIPWWTHGTVLYIAWQALLMSTWVWLTSLALARTPMASLIRPVDSASRWWGNLAVSDPDAVSDQPADARRASESPVSR